MSRQAKLLGHLAGDLVRWQIWQRQIGRVSVFGKRCGAPLIRQRHGEWEERIRRHDARA
jgi:hypothetical protein